MVGYDQSNGSMAASLEWLTEVALGPVGTALAILAVAALGLSMLQGRFPAMRGGAAILGCFIFVSSHFIAAGILNASSTDVDFGHGALLTEPPSYIAPVSQPVPYDPYAGASVPVPPPDGARNVIPQ